MRRPPRFRFVDFAAAGQPGFRNHVVAIEEVADLVARYHAFECYASIFSFADDVLLYLTEHRVNGRASIAGYDGKVWAPFLPLDIDAGATELDVALDLARRAYQLLTTRWMIPEGALHAYFSGAKGFHLLIDTRVFGRVLPSRHLPAIFSRIRLDLLRSLPDSARPFVDLSIGDTVRLLRLPNTRHRESGLYKVPLSTTELLQTDIAAIRNLAQSPRPLSRVRAAGLLPAAVVGAVPQAVELFDRARRAVRRARGPHPYRPPATPAEPETALCAARQAIWQRRIPPGNRNNVAIRLASAFRLAGYTADQTRALLLAWNARLRNGLPESEIIAVVHSAYVRPYPYAYGCHDEVIREFCPYVGRLADCEDYRALHRRSERDL